jgi:hypothetical protein
MLKFSVAIMVNIVNLLQFPDLQTKSQKEKESSSKSGSHVNCLLLDSSPQGDTISILLIFLHHSCLHPFHHFFLGFLDLSARANSSPWAGASLLNTTLHTAEDILLLSAHSLAGLQGGEASRWKSPSNRHSLMGSPERFFSILVSLSSKW